MGPRLDHIPSKMALHREISRSKLQSTVRKGLWYMLAANCASGTNEFLFYFFVLHHSVNSRILSI